MNTPSAIDRDLMLTSANGTTRVAGRPGNVSDNIRQQVDESGKVHQVHKEYPDENRQGRRRNQLWRALVHVFDAAMHKTDYQLNRGLKLARHAAGRF